MSEISKNLASVASLGDEFPPVTRPRPDPQQRRVVREVAREEGFGFAKPDPELEQGDAEPEGEGQSPSSDAPAPRGGDVVRLRGSGAPADGAKPKRGRVKLSAAVGQKSFLPDEDRTQMNIYTPVSVAQEFHELERLSGKKKAELIALAIPLLRAELKLKKTGR